MNLKLDLNEALKLASVLDEVIQADFFAMTSDNFQSSIVRVHNRVVDLIGSDLGGKEE